jgi:predicted ATP-grasp superfamily ATP-dependent carboligase
MSMKDSLNMMNEVGNKGFDRINALGELNLKLWEKLAARQMEAFNSMLEQGVRQMTIASEAKGYNELLNGQLEMAKEAGERVMAENKANMELAGEVRDEYRAWIQSGVTELTAQVRKTSTAA